MATSSDLKLQNNRVKDASLTRTADSDNLLTQVLKSFYAPIEKELGQAEQLLRKELRNDSPFVNELLEYGGQLGGKRLRPALLLLTAKAAGTVNENHFVLAAVIEMIHTATLVHDDVLDEAKTRRHLATVNSRWNNETSVLLGDYLFTHSFYLASTLETTYGCRRIGHSTNIVCEGELRQIASRGNYGLTEEEYYSIIDGKTAELCACACHLGAYYANASDEIVSGLERFGRSLGMAFQIADDLLDLLGEEGKTGKSLGTDLEKQKATLPVIHALQAANSQHREELLELLNNPIAVNQTAILEILHQYDAFDYARGKALQFIEQAQSELEILPPTECREVLSDLTHFVISRSH